MKALMSTDLKRYGKQVNQILGKYMDDPALAPSVDMGQEEEHDFLKSAIPLLESHFCCKVELYLEEDSKEKKAANAMPGRSAIMID